MRVAVWVGIAAAAVQVTGLLRWPLLVPGYASDAAGADATVAARARDAFTTAGDILGTALGETLGYLLTAAWNGARRHRAHAAPRRPLVQRARTRVRCPRGGRRALAARSAHRRYRELLRLHPLERLDDPFAVLILRHQRNAAAQASTPQQRRGVVIERRAGLPVLVHFQS